MRCIPTVVFLGTLLGTTFTYADYKYQEGDCITSTNETWSWHKGFARVGGVFERKDADYYGGNTVYLLHIVKGASTWTKIQGKQQGMFALTEVNENTQQVPSWMCDPD